MCDNSDNYPLKNNIYANFKQRIKAENGLIKCKKCQLNNGFVLLQRKDVFCRNCFYDYCTHKFRSTIGKSKLVRTADRVLIAFSGGINSSALIHMISEGLNDSQHKKLRFVPSIVYIDERIIKNESNEESVFEEIKDIMLKTGWNCLLSSIEMSYRCHNSNFYVDLNKQLDKDLLLNSGQQFMASFSSIKSLTSKEEFLKRMRYLLVCDIAMEEKFDKIFFANNASNLAINLISDVAIGKGIQLQSETGFVDNRHEIPILRPMREFTAKEIAFYAVMKQCKYVTKSTLATNSSIKSSIQRLTESFVNELQNDFPSTVYTIFKTGNKLKSCDQKVDKKCIICKTSIDTIERPKCSAYEALRLTNILSKNLNSDPISDSEVSVENLESTQLCYSCKIISNEMTLKDDKFPQILYKKVDKNDFKEFLIESNDDEVQ